MVAFQGAVDLGYRWLETDLHCSSDGVLMCVHDDTVDRTTNATGRIGAFSASELQGLDAGRALASFGGGRVGVPPLEEVLQSFPEASLVVDLKEDGLEPLLWDLLVRTDAVDRVIVGSFSGRRLRIFRQVSGGAVATSAGPAAVARVRIGRSGRPPRRVADALQLPERVGRVQVVNPGLVDRVRRAGMATHVWTVNDPADMERLLDWGVDGVITDRPDLLKEVLVGRGMWDT